MKIFKTNDKINFVDNNNVFVGFDFTACCCEDFNYLLTLTIPTSESPSDSLSPESLEKYSFDTRFFQSLVLPSADDGAAVVFRMKNGSDVAYLTIYNHHNGYYNHGFEFGYNYPLKECNRTLIVSGEI